MSDKSPLAQGEEPLRLTIAQHPESAYTPNHIPLLATFENIADECIVLLNHFEPIPVFFAFRMVDDGGRSVPIPGAGKIDFYRDSMRYIELWPGASLTVELDLADVLAYPDEVTAGRFTVSASYHNQYGDGCFVGSVDSDPIEVTLVANDGKNRSAEDSPQP